MIKHSCDDSFEEDCETIQKCYFKIACMRGLLIMGGIDDGYYNLNFRRNLLFNTKYQEPIDFLKIIENLELIDD